MKGTMQDYPLTIRMIFEHGRTVYPDSEVVTFEGDTTRRATFAQVGERVEKLARALKRLGVKRGDRVGTFCWNNQEHLEAYFAVPSMGAVLHTLNIRLFPEQLAYVINHAEDKVIIVDDTLVPLLARVKDQIKGVEHFIVTGSGDASELGDVLRYDDLLKKAKAGFKWPKLNERSAAAMCYTSGTTGDPKGVVYEHRSTFLHSMAECSGASFGLSEHDRILAIVPMFHAMCWGLPYSGWMVGADFVFPTRFLQAEPLTRLIAQERPTFSGAVPTVWNDVLRYGETNDVDLSSLRMVVCGGSAVPLSLMQRFEEKYGMRIIQAWGMTETSPLGAVAHPPKDLGETSQWEWRNKTGRVTFGIELRIVDDAGNELPWDGRSVGEIEVRGPWITGAYYNVDDAEKFHDGWLRTGDVGHVNEKGFVQITDRAKDVIKSGGEWISTVELENLLMAHPDVAEAAVIGIPDERWDERPLACVVLNEGTAREPEKLKAFLGDKVAKWWLPERWAFVDEIPKTSVGKFDKKVLRARHGEGVLEVAEVSQGSR